MLRTVPGSAAMADDERQSAVKRGSNERRDLLCVNRHCKKRAAHHHDE
jgi:hypothetical protein